MKRLFIPKTDLYLTDMSSADHQHAKTALADTAAHRQWQITCQKHAVKRKTASIITARERELTVKRFWIDADAHGGNLDCAAENFIPIQDIAVEFPIIIVRRAAIMFVAGAERFTNLHQEYYTMLAANLVFALLRRQIRVKILQFLGCDEIYVSRELGAQ